VKRKRIFLVIFLLSMGVDSVNELYESNQMPAWGTSDVNYRNSICSDVLDPGA